jgi:hypothetical protein
LDLGIISAKVLPAQTQVCPPPQEKPVNSTKPHRADLKQILSGNANIKAAARTNQQGSVLEVAGEMDAETACAVAAMASQMVAEATSEAGLGPPSAWHVSLGTSTFYVVQDQEELVVMSGNASRNPATMLKTLAQSCGG